METVKQKTIGLLTSKGMFPQDAEKVLAAALPDLEAGGYKMDWNAPADAYPLPMYAVMSLTLSRHALDYIKANCPKAWYRPMFES